MEIERFRSGTSVREFAVAVSHELGCRMSPKKSKRVALVLAGSRGLGLASAKALVDRGNRVAICGRSPEDVESAAKQLNSGVNDAMGVVGDVGNPAQLDHVFERVRRKMGPISVLVANAGGPRAGAFGEVSLSDWDDAYRLTLRSFVQAVDCVLPDMRRTSWGRILLIGSSSIRRPLPRLVLSNTFRPALNGLVKDLAIRLAPERITVNVVAPGRIDTDRVRQLDALAAEREQQTVERVRERSEQAIPMGRYGETCEFGGILGFLAGDEASYITGQSILVDGGLTASLP